MKTLLLLTLLACSLQGATHIQWHVLINDGVTPATGKIFVSGPSGCTVATTSQTVIIGSAGLVDFNLIGGPACSYRAQYTLTTSSGITTTRWEERWIVPDTTNVLTIPMLWGGSAAPQYLVSPQQVNPAGLAPGQTWIWDGAAYAPRSIGAFDMSALTEGMQYCIVKVSGVATLVPCTGSGGSGALSLHSLTNAQLATLTNAQLATLTN